MWICGEYPSIATPCNHGHQEICERELIPLGREVMAERSGPTPVFPACLDIMSHPQSGRNPICLILSAKTQQDFREDWSNEGHAIGIYQHVDGRLFRRTGFTEESRPDARIDKNPIVHGALSVTGG